MAKIRQLDFPYNLFVRIIKVETKAKKQGELIANIVIKKTLLCKLLERISSLWRAKT